MGYISLHQHSEHSFLDAIPTMDQMAERAVALGQDAVAVTDHGECSGHLALQRAAKKHDLKPIFGMEGYFCPDRFQKGGYKGENYEHMTLVAVTPKGLQNLWALSSRAFTEGYYRDPRFDWELLEQYNEGLVATGGCLSGNVMRFMVEPEPLPAGANAKDKAKWERKNKYDPDEAISRLARFMDIFEDRFYLELITFGEPIQKQANNAAVKLASEFGVPLIATTDSHYAKPEDWEDHELLTAIQMGKAGDNPDRYSYGYGALAMDGEQGVRERLSYLGDSVVDEAIANVSKIVEPIDIEIREDRSMPVFFEDTKTDAMRIREMADEGFERKIIPNVSEDAVQEYRERLEYELNIILDKGFPGYFLMTADITKWCKSQGILVGPSRGSAGGSLLAYVLDITEIDPIAHGLFFERFLDPGRDSLPDIDIDVPQHQRQEVKDYLEKRYGKDSIATIGTINRQSPKALLRDLCRGLHIPHQDANDMSKIIDKMPDLDVAHIETAWPMIMEELEEEFAPYIRKAKAHPEYERLFDLMEKFSGHVRHAGAHAAGVVISQESLIGRLPLRMKNDDVRTQMEAKDVEYLGYVKMDLLGLRTLSTLSHCLDLVRERHPEADIPDYNDWQYEWSKYYEDPDVFQSMWGGKNIGIFQLETSGFRQHIKWFKPESMEDISALISVNRPGNTRATDEATGLTLIDLYRQRREGKRDITYKHPLLREVLDVTSGNFIYQEQVMKACVVLAGYDLAETDRVRQILGKKKVDLMPEERRIFVEGCKKTNDIGPDLANTIFDEMESFAQYGFNKAHAFAYSIVGWWCAWMKYYYPREFMTALFLTNEEQSAIYQRECQRLHIPIQAPDVNESDVGFSLTDGGVIRYGLSRIKFLATGASTIKELAPFSDMKDFVNRVSGRVVNKRAAEAAIAVGAMNSLITGNGHPDWWTTEQKALYEYWEARGDWKPDLPKGITKTLLKTECEGIGFGLNDRCIWSFDGPHTVGEYKYGGCEAHSNFEHYCDELGIKDLGDMEEEYLGSLITVDPLRDYMTLISNEDNYLGEETMLVGEVCRVGGLITGVRELVTKRGRNPGQPMCQMFLELPAALEDEDAEDKEDQVQVVVFPSSYSVYSNKIEKGAPVLCDVEKLDGGGVSLKRLFRLDELVN